MESGHIKEVFYKYVEIDASTKDWANIMSSQLVNYNDLKTWSDVKQRNKLIEWLKENHIAYRLNRDGFPVTTVDAINKSLSPDNNDDVVDF